MGGATRFFVLLSGPLPLIHHRRPSLFCLASHYHNFIRSSLQPNTRILSPSFHPIRASRQLHSQASSLGDDFGNFEDSGSANGLFSPDSYTWRELSKFLGSLDAGGYFGREDSGNEFIAVQELPVEFVNAANACLAFSRECEHLLGLLPRRDIEVLVESVSPSLFRDGDASLRKMKLFLRGEKTQVLDSDKARTIDLFKFILSYARNSTFSSESNLFRRDLVESSMRNLLSEICKLCFSNPDQKLLETVNQFSNSDKYGQSRGPYEPKVEMKRGDWICPRCSFMNFARNVKCLECEETRPKQQLIGGEWECPQCDFFNYGKNTVCLRCDCKRPGPPSLSTININSGLGSDNGSRATMVDIDSKLAANEEKAQRWFSKISQLDSTFDSGTSINDEDFPEIMPLRKGVNRFVVSTRKTPLERRLTNAQYRRNLGNDGVPENNSSERVANNLLDKTISQSLDDILGRTSTNSQTTNVGNEQGIGTDNTLSSNSGSLQFGSLQGSNSSYVPFVPLPPNTFAKKPKNSSMESEVVSTDNNKSLSSGSNEWTGSACQSNELNEVRDIPSPLPNQTEKINDGKEEAQKSERWFKRVAELHNVTDLTSAISDEDFPEIMPMRKGENRFVVSKKKDRSLTSPVYKRRAAMEQTGSSNFLPFVPFPPDYFAKKDKPLSDDSNSKVIEVQSNDTKLGVDDRNNTRQSNNQETQTGRFNSELSTGISSRNDEAAEYRVPNIRNSDTNFVSSQLSHENASSSDCIERDANKNTSVAGSSSTTLEMQNIREKWSGKSLEGSAVTEPDPLDMSEEAKAQRWFRRVAQIKDISELSQIPDEDFPSIMPMRKGVNRFVVSKRKTPLERRLTSPQYRRNLPIVSSDPPKRENDGS